jgi:hypothetical protein
VSADALQPTITLRSILAGRPAVFVRHDAGGGWSVFDENQNLHRDDLVLAPFERLLQAHPELAEVADLPAGWQAWRESPEGPWERETIAGLEATRARTGRLLEELRRNPIRLPEGFPSSLELLREDRDR